EHRESEDGEGAGADEQGEDERDGQPHLRLLRHESILRRGDRRVHSATSATRGLDLRGLGRGRTRAWTGSGPMDRSEGDGRAQVASATTAHSRTGRPAARQRGRRSCRPASAMDSPSPRAVTRETPRPSATSAADGPGFSPCRVLTTVCTASGTPLAVAATVWVRRAEIALSTSGCVTSPSFGSPPRRLRKAEYASSFDLKTGQVKGLMMYCATP